MGKLVAQYSKSKLCHIALHRLSYVGKLSYICIRQSTNEKLITYKRIGLLPRVIIAMAAGICIGTVSPAWIARLMATFNGLFSEYLGFLIPLIIIGFVTPAIIDIGNRAGRMLLATVLLAYIATILSGLFSYVCGVAVFRH